jgi:AhpD family alkylhydroperoxidase
VYLFLSAFVYMVGKETYTMKLDQRIQRLIAVGAAISANCQPCLQTNVTEALKEGADEQEIAEAIEVGKRVRQGAAVKMNSFILSLKDGTSIAAGLSTDGCGCSS